MLKIGIQSETVMSQLGAERGCELFREAGFEVIDWNINDEIPIKRFMEGERSGISIFEKPLPEIMDYFKDTLRCFEKNGLQITQMHGPFPAWREDCPELLDYVIATTIQCIRLCDAIGCPYIVVHGVSLKKNWENTTYEQIREINRKLYTSLIPVLRETNVTVCLENLFSTYKKEVYEGICNNPYEAIEWIDSLNAEVGKECFGLCFDTGHLHLMRGDMHAYLLKLGKRIKALHIHDNCGSSDDHRAPYTGTIIWEDLCTTLAEIGYTGELNFETVLQTKIGIIPEELVLPWLRLIHDTGVYFKQKIQG